MILSLRFAPRPLWAVATVVATLALLQGCASDSKQMVDVGSDSTLTDATLDATDRGEAGSDGTETGDAGAASADESQDASSDATLSTMLPFDATKTGFVEWNYNGKPYGLYVPPATGKALPVLTYLHACHNDPVSADYWIIAAANAKEPTVVFLPTAPPAMDFTCADWGGTYDDTRRPNMNDALSALDKLVALYGLDTKREFLYGESMGGEGVYRLLMDFPNRFAAGVSASGYTKNTGAANMAKTPLWIFHGTDDDLSPVASDQTIYQAIIDAGGTQVKYTEYAGLGHVPTIERARTEPGLFDWIFTQHR